MNFLTNLFNSAALICLFFAFAVPFIRSKFQNRVLKRTVWEDGCRKYIWFVCLLAFIRQFLGEQFIIPSESMKPNLLVGDYIWVNKTAYSVKIPFLNDPMIDISEPDYGDVVLFHYPFNPSQIFIKRLLAKPGDTVKIVRGKVVVVQETVPVCRKGFDTGGYELELGRGGSYITIDAAEDVDVLGDFLARFGGEYMVPKGSYFVLGDNRPNSSDSRFWGVVEHRLLVGKATNVLLTIEYANDKDVWPTGWIDGVSFSRSGYSVGNAFDESSKGSILLATLESSAEELCQ